MNFDTHSSPPPSPYLAPTSCPICRSASIQTTAKIPDASTYWRCLACGEVWNVARAQAPRNDRRGWR